VQRENCTAAVTFVNEGASSQQSAQVVDQVDDMATSVHNAERQTSRLASSYYALIAWVAGVTAAVIAVTVVTVYRRRSRRPAAVPRLDTASVSSSAVSSTSPITIDSVERCSSSVDVTLPEVAEVTSASELRSDVSPIICDDDRS